MKNIYIVSYIPFRSLDGKALIFKAYELLKDAKEMKRILKNNGHTVKIEKVELIDKGEKLY